MVNLQKVDHAASSILFYVSKQNKYTQIAHHVAHVAAKRSLLKLITKTTLEGRREGENLAQVAAEEGVPLSFPVGPAAAAAALSKRTSTAAVDLKALSAAAGP